MKDWFFKRPRLMRWGINLWPPFLLNGIWVEKLADDYSYARVRLRASPLTRNINGSQYGGNLFSMTDPIYATLLLGKLGWQRYYVWDKSAEIDYVKPGHGPVFFEARVDAAMMADILSHTAGGEKYLPQIEGVIRNRQGDTVATVKRTLYVRLKPAYRPDNL